MFKITLTLLILFLFTGCGSPKILNVSQPLKRIKISTSQMQSAIVDAASKSGWKINQNSDGKLTAKYTQRTHSASVSIEYASNFYNIIYMDSKNLNKRGNTIHKAYNDWVNKFNQNIRINLKNIDRGTFKTTSTLSKAKKPASVLIASKPKAKALTKTTIVAKPVVPVVTTVAVAASAITASETFKFKDSNVVKYNDFALVIGIADYKRGPDVAFADNSALAFKELAHRTFGLPNENIITLLNDDASSGSIKSNLHLLKELADEDSTIYLYFAGHGLPSRSGETYLLPYDMSASAIEIETQLRLDNIYELLAKSSAKDIFVILDSCFSGKDDSGSLLYQGVAPVFKVKKAEPKKRMTVFAAGGPEEFANDFKSKQQRMFTYYFINAVSAGNKTSGDIYKYTKSKVKRKSLYKGLIYKQVPTMDGDKENSLY